jgi:hypothetical protein
MKPKARFIKSVIEAARQNQTEMPWARGNRRAAFIASRKSPTSALGLKTAWYHHSLTAKTAALHWETQPGAALDRLSENSPWQLSGRVLLFCLIFNNYGDIMPYSGNKSACPGGITPTPGPNVGDFLTIRTIFEHYCKVKDDEHQTSVHLSLLVGASADATLLKGPN